MGLFSFLTQEIAIDLGTANTIIIHNDKIVVDEPSIVAIDVSTGKLFALGEKARQMHGKTHDNIKVIRPLRDGVIADFNAAEMMIRGMINWKKSTTIRQKTPRAMIHRFWISQGFIRFMDGVRDVML